MAAYAVLMPLAPWESAAVVEETLASLAAQTHPPAQVVISGDGPLSPPLQLLLDRMQGPLPLLRLEGPGGEGVGPVLARGLWACGQELVLRSDADDLSLPERAERQLAAMAARPDLAAISATIEEFVAVPGGRRPIGQRAVPTGARALRRFSRWRNPLNHPATLLRRSSVLAVGNYRHCPGFEDYDLWLRLLAAGYPLDNLNTVLVMARVDRAHRRRRRGLRYVAQEWSFLRRAARERLLPRHQALLLGALRTPVRLLPVGLIDGFMRGVLRQ